jgi:hypothetical protein
LDFCVLRLFVFLFFVLYNLTRFVLYFFDFLDFLDFLDLPAVLINVPFLISISSNSSSFSIPLLDFLGDRSGDLGNKFIGDSPVNDLDDENILDISGDDLGDKFIGERPGDLGDKFIGETPGDLGDKFIGERPGDLGDKFIGDSSVNDKDDEDIFDRSGDDLGDEFIELILYNI